MGSKLSNLLAVTNPSQNNTGLGARSVNQLGDGEVGRVIGGRYLILGAVGTGASATVYLAEDQSLRRQVAVKLLHPALVGDPKFRRRFRAEAQAAAQMSHPHLMAVHDWGDEHEAYIVTELLSGGSLREIIDSEYRLSLSQALVVGLHASEGLAHAHERGFVHRDIKPANLLFGSDGRLRVADFGIARAVAEAAWTEPEGALIGTARYAAPEQAAGSNVDGRADVYSLALTLVEAVTGSVPLVEATPLATMLARQDRDIGRVDELGPLADVLAAAGRVDRDRRPTSNELVQALTAAAGTLPRPKRLPVSTLHQSLQDRAELATTTAGTGDGQVRGAPISSGAPIKNDATTNIVDVRRDGQPVVHLDTDLGTNSAHHSIEHYMDLEQPQPAKPKRAVWPWILALVALAVSGLAILNLARGTLTPDEEVISTTTTVVTHPVGTFIGRPVEEAKRALVAANLSVVVFERREDGTAAGDVLEQTPAPGVILDEGGEVTLWVSQGPKLRGVPVLAGLSLADARTALLDVGLFVGSVNNANDEEISAGSVISAEYDSGTELEFGDKVDLVVSDGAVQRVVPNLVGVTPDAATEKLTDFGLVYAASEEGQSSETIAEGLIVSADIVEGTLVDKGSTITVTLSTGLPFVKVPDVKGLTGTEAAQELEAAGFRIEGMSGSPTGIVIETSPAIGTNHRKGTDIFILVG